MGSVRRGSIDVTIADTTVRTFGFQHEEPPSVFRRDNRPRVHGYLASVIRDLDSPWVVVGGVADHVHILFDMGKMVAPVKFVEQVKRESSKFVKTLDAKYA